MAMVMAATGKGRWVNPHSTEARLAARHGAVATLDANILRERIRAAGGQPTRVAAAPVRATHTRAAEAQRTLDNTFALGAVLAGGTLGTTLGAFLCGLIGG